MKILSALFFYFLSLAILLPDNCYSQVSTSIKIFGRLKEDKENGVPFGVVSLYDKNKAKLISDTTDIDGNYSFETNSMNGKYLVASCLGYLTDTVCSNFKSTTKMDVTLIRCRPTITYVRQSTQTSSDTIFTDITEEYKVVLPNLSKFLSADVGVIWAFNVSVIPLNEVGKKNISWSHDKAESAHNSELVFENEMLHCKTGYYLSMEGPRLPGDSVKAEVEKKTNYCMTNYCQWTEFRDYNMGTSTFTNYVGFEKSNCLIIFRFTNSEHNCLHGYSEPGEHELIMQCERDKRRSRIVIDAFINFVIEKLELTKVDSK